MFTNTPVMYHSILSPPEMFRVRVQNVSHHDKQRALTLFATADYHLADNVLNPTPIHRKNPMCGFFLFKVQRLKVKCLTVNV